MLQRCSVVYRNWTARTREASDTYCVVGVYSNYQVIYDERLEIADIGAQSRTVARLRTTTRAICDNDAVVVIVFVGFHYYCERALVNY